MDRSVGLQTFALPGRKLRLRVLPQLLEDSILNTKGNLERRLLNVRLKVLSKRLRVLRVSMFFLKLSNRTVALVQ